MEEQVYLIKTVEQGQKLWEQLKEEEWESVIVCFHEDLLNLDVKNRLLPMLHKYQIEDAQVHWVEPETAFISGSSSFGGGISLNYYVKIEQLMFEYGMHAALPVLCGRGGENRGADRIFGWDHSKCLRSELSSDAGEK